MTTSGHEAEVERLLKRIADALDRAYPVGDDTFDIGPIANRRLVEPKAPMSGMYASARAGLVHEWRIYPIPEGDHILHDDGHEGEELE